MKILIIQLRRIGDILLTGPAAIYLKEAFPQATLHILTEPMGKSVMETHPAIDQVQIYDRSDSWGMIKKIRAEKYDAVLDFMNNPRTAYLTFLSGARWRVGWKHPLRQIFYKTAVPVPAAPEYVPLRKIRMVKEWLNRMGMPSPEPRIIRPEIFLTEKDEQVASAWMEKERLQPKGFVIFAAASRIPVRSWKKERYRNVALSLAKHDGKRVYIAWGPGEEEFVADVRKGEEDKIGRLPLTSMREMAAIFKKAALVLTVDCGAMHTAVSMGTPTVTIYGPTRPIDWNPSLSGLGPWDIPVNVPDLDCLGCHLHECPIGHLCMENLTEDRVLAACRKILSNQGE